MWVANGPLTRLKLLLDLFLSRMLLVKIVHYLFWERPESIRNLKSTRTQSFCPLPSFFSHFTPPTQNKTAAPPTAPTSAKTPTPQTPCPTSNLKEASESSPVAAPATALVRVVAAPPAPEVTTVAILVATLATADCLVWRREGERSQRQSRGTNGLGARELTVAVSKAPSAPS